MRALQKAKMTVKNIKQEIERLDELKRQKEKELTEAINQLKRFKRLQELSASEKVLTWTHEKRERFGEEPFDVFTFRSGLYDFNIYIKQRKDLKVWKYEVEVKLYQTRYDCHERSYIDYNYGDRLYRERKQGKDGRYQYFDIPGKEMAKKFKTWNDAFEFVKHWQERIMADHEKEIEEEYLILVEITKQNMVGA